MKTPNLAFHLAAGSLLAMGIGSFVGACSSNGNNGNPAPSSEDGGNDVTSSSSSGAGSSSGSSSGAGSSSGSSSGGYPDDGPSFDTGSCVSDAATCNSCYTATQAAADPYNACSPYAVNCTRFDNGRVPLIDGGVPAVP